MATLDFLGTGVKFPFRISTSTGGLETSTGETHVIESLQQIVGCTVGMRVMRRDYGSKLALIPFEPQDAATLALIQHYVTGAVQRWEKRIILLNVSVELNHEEGVILISLDFKYAKTNTFGNLVYPYYIER